MTSAKLLTFARSATAATVTRSAAHPAVRTTLTRVDWTVHATIFPIGGLVAQTIGAQHATGIHGHVGRVNVEVGPPSQAAPVDLEPDGAEVDASFTDRVGDHVQEPACFDVHHLKLVGTGRLGLRASVPEQPQRPAVVDGEVADVGQGSVQEDVDVVDDGVRGQAQVAFLVDVDAEGQVDLVSLQVHGLVGSHVDGAGAVADHVVEGEGGRGPCRLCQHGQLSAAVDLNLVEVVSVVD